MGFNKQAFVVKKIQPRVMKKVIVFLLLFVVKSGITFSQDTIFILHPSVGAIIDKYEKMNYLLFPEIKDTSFQYCYLKPLKGNYGLFSYFHNDSLSITRIDSLDLSHYQTNISKLDEYFSNRSKTDSLRIIDQNNIDNPNLKFDILSPNMIKDIKNESLKNARLKEDEERMKRIQQGTEISPVDIYLFDIFHKKKK